MAKQHQSLSLLSVFVGLVFHFKIIEISGSECGAVNILVPQIFGGNQTNRGEWPFLAALYYTEKMEFFCGGTLISIKHVLTAAHCIDSKLNPNGILVFLGAFNLLSTSEEGVLQREVSEIHVHPDWQVDSKTYDADIAILILTENVTFTTYIRPICMPADDIITNGVKGSIVGWGLADNGTRPNLDFPRHAITNALNASYCLTTDPYVSFLSSTRTFCGSGGDGTPQQGDSGGGFFVFFESAWVQYGIISALRINQSHLVDVNSFSVYTNVKLFKNWIDKTVTKSGGVVMTIEKKISLGCIYQTDNFFGYTCYIGHGLDIQSENFEITSVIGSHISGVTNLNVKSIEFRIGTMFYLPNGIGKNLKNLNALVVVGFVRLRLIRRSNFKNMETLVNLLIYNNEIEKLNEETLWDLPNLEIFLLNQNKLKVIQERTFEKNIKLRQVSLAGNRLEFLPKNLFKENVLLSSIFFSGNSLKIIEIDFKDHFVEITFDRNVCIDKRIDTTKGSYEDYLDFQRQVKVNCSSVDPIDAFMNLIFNLYLV